MKEQGDQLNVHSKKTLTYDQYLPLLKSAAQSYDRKYQRHKMSTRSRRIVHNHEVIDTHAEVQESGEDLVIQAEFHDAQDTLGDEEFDIDTPISIIEANMNNVRGRPRPVQMGYDKWSKITTEEKAAWNKISDKSKRIILGSSQGTATQDPATYRPLAHRLMPPSHRKTNAHYLCESDVNEFVDARVHQILANSHKVGDNSLSEVQDNVHTNAPGILALAANRFN